MSTTPEEAPKGNESLKTPEASAEQYEALRDKIEAGAEIGIENAEKTAEKAKIEALETAISIEAGSAEKARKEPKSAAPAKRRGTISKKEKEASFKRHMKNVQAEMPPVQRAFSKFIHAKAIERTSEVVGGTIARPNAILSGAIVAFVLVLAVYLIAKHLGYVLSGFETIAAFAVGWIIGLLYDFFRVMITGKKS
ncbi:MAG: hypothetical protein ABIP50_00030 [Candidatus Saccharimonadales bacterium]